MYVKITLCRLFIVGISSLYQDNNHFLVCYVLCLGNIEVEYFGFLHLTFFFIVKLLILFGPY